VLSCLCRERTRLVHGVLLILSAHHKLSTGGQYNNGKDLDKGWEKTASRTPCGVYPGSPPVLQAEAGWFPIAQGTTGARIW
jgi:hypothetical protein